MRRRGRVLGRAAAGRWQVALDDSLGCARCASGRGCQFGMGSVGAPLIVDCEADAGPAPVKGDAVDIELAESAGWLLPVTLAYGLPLLGLLAGVLLAATPWDAPAGALGLAGGVLAWRVLLPGVQQRLEARPCSSAVRIVSIVASATAMPSAAAEP